MRRVWLPLTAIVLTLSHAGEAQAHCCTGIGDCPSGFACLPLGDAGQGACSSDFTTCACDDECAPGLRCMPGARTLCVGDNSDTCSLAGQCAAPWQMPCSTAADCGEGGFACVANGSLCTASTGCQTTTSCVAPALPDTCTTDSDCPAGWTCLPDTAADTLCVVFTQHCPMNGCPAPTGKMLCRPPLWELVGSNSWTGPPVTANACPALGGGSKVVGAPASGSLSGGGCQLGPRGRAGGFACAISGILVWARLRRRSGFPTTSRRPSLR